ncbi:MAG: KH domain-containing protein [Candidatus Atribacteria bacterium]|nr:KH domain-containing protein [Candidatus Atribacteria bacterium]
MKEIELLSNDNYPEEKLSQLDESAYQVLVRIVNAIIEGSEVKMMSFDQRQAIFIISKADPGIIIGKHGHTLDAIQYLLNLVVNKGKDYENKRNYLVDIDGYRERREASLKKYAMEKAQIAKQNGRSIALYFMNSIERRLVHMALKDDPDITTQSEGKEPFRRIIITPASSSQTGHEKEGES